MTGFSYFVILNGMFERLADLTSFSDAFSISWRSLMN